LAGLTLAAAVGVSLVRLARLAERSLELDRCRVQADWLAESALERAAARLAADASYQGETWTLAAVEFAGRRGGQAREANVLPSAGDGGRVLIRVEPAAGPPDRRRVHVEADYSSGRARQTRDITMTLPKGTQP
jgi:hypothetical protein